MATASVGRNVEINYDEMSFVAFDELNPHKARTLLAWALLSIAVGWIFLGEIVTGWLWTPPGNSSVPAALTLATYGAGVLVIKWPVIPWLAVTILAWVFGRHLIRFAAGQSTISGRNVLWI